MKNFVSEMENTLGVNNNLPGNYSVTENGALGYRTSGSALVDLNFAVASLRKQPFEVAADKFAAAFAENPELAVKWLFFARDVRGGLGERKIPRQLFQGLAELFPKQFRNLLPLISEFGRWDDLMPLMRTPLRNDVVALIATQLTKDHAGMQRGESISLMAKWLPSINTSSPQSRAFGRELAKALGMSECQYRKQLSMLRKHIGVLEQLMSSKQWEDIDYTAVPSRANLLYANAFMRNDTARRNNYLQALTDGETKINAGTLYPHDIVYRYRNGYDVGPLDVTLEELWKALPNTIEPNATTLVVADGSGSMTQSIGSGSVEALDVANALAIYFAEKLQGEFANKYVTFSSRPQLVDLSKGTTLRDKLEIAYQHSEVDNTDIGAVFRLVLDTATRAKMSQDQLPSSILIISDMEFDSASCTGNTATARVFDTIQAEYARAGYLVPRLVFWNVNSRTGTIPVKENDLGVALISGFSVNLAQMVMSGKTDPYEVILDVLMGERYHSVVWTA